jgi:hypothetical protein
MTRRGEPLNRGRRSVAQHEAGRVCESPNCDTQLSIYNGSGQCSVHERSGFPTAGFQRQLTSARIEVPGRAL